MRAGNTGRPRHPSRSSGVHDRIWRERVGRGRGDCAAGGHRQRHRGCVPRHRGKLQRDAADAAAGLRSRRSCAKAEGRTMKAASFDYVAVKTVADASAALASAGATTAAIAGGQSLLPMLNLRVALPDLVVDLNGVHELKE